MAKDYGARTLPIGVDFADVSGWPGSETFPWHELLKALDQLLTAVMDNKTPEWIFGGDMFSGSRAIVMYIPTSSRMSRKWASDMRGTLPRPGDVHEGVSGSA